MSTAKTEKTDLQRDILLTWYENPNATNKEIAKACDCSASYVSQVTNRFEDYNEMEAMMDRQDKEMERMFGGDIFQSMPSSNGQYRIGASSGPSLVEIYTEQPDNLIGYLVRAAILLFLLYIFYEAAMVLVF
ncbi:winged helix-turn-helix domain-containing protein [Natrinema zhouii]|uniref:Winged helix-turn-helix domain-containing protein n=2 Tax=Natrinema TaxID=88723 RepID=A0A7D6GUL1_9EURY|nr:MULTISPECIES: winged helix-turn-helix domain-containing protein [Natrinema]QLK25126.1 winged helix-turn-helix domain-containing protein [Natrinema zhouii]